MTQPVSDNASILVVDDNPLIVNVLKSLLASENYQVFTSSNGNEAYEVLNRKNVDGMLGGGDMPKITRVLGLTALMVLFVTPAHAKPQAVAPTDVNVAKINYKKSDVICNDNVPGSLSVKNSTIFFRSARETRNRFAKDSKNYTIQSNIIKKGGRACRESTVSLPQGAYSASKSIAGAISSAGAPVMLLKQLIGSISAARLTEGASISDLLAQLQSALASCATITFVSPGVLVAFNESGCSLFGFTLTGSFTLTNISETTLRIDFDNLSANSRTVNGSAEFAFDTSLTVALNLTTTLTGESTTVVFNGTVDLDQTGLLLSGTGSVTSANVKTGITVSSLHKSNDGSCYPDAGTVVLDFFNSPDVTVTFSSATPSTGAVNVAIGGLESSYTLPACPG